MGSDIVKNQHYVPQVYLRQFAEITKDVAKINVFDKSNSQVRLNQNVKNVASERYYHDVDHMALIQELLEEGANLDKEFIDSYKDIDKQEVEHYFAEKVETDAFNPIKDIISTHTMIRKSAYPTFAALTIDKLYSIAFYMVQQFRRTKVFREEMVQLYETEIENTVKHLAFEKGVEPKLRESAITLLHKRILFNRENIVEVVETLVQNIWYIAVNESKSQFYTSDNPVIIQGHCGEWGLIGKGVELVMPINPNLAIVMLEKGYFKDRVLMNNRFISVPEWFVKNCNDIQVGQCYRYIFSKGNDFSVAHETLKPHPELRNIGRKKG